MASSRFVTLDPIADFGACACGVRGTWRFTRSSLRASSALASSVSAAWRMGRRSASYVELSAVCSAT
ncbi:MAG TPA: hypothetical protein VKU86_10365 [Acidimicrobiales bacterium]|nr:hypothetical protein [Acidimicrobiales bacterium]